MTVWDFASEHYIVALLMVMVITAPLRMAVFYHFHSRRED